MEVQLGSIPVREALHFLGWRGTPVEPELMQTLRTLCRETAAALEPRAILRRFPLRDGDFDGTGFRPRGRDARALLATCREGVLLAATLGAGSERMLLREQARGASRALLLDAVLSAGIEAVCDGIEARLREECEAQGLFLTDRFSPGYGDMPLAQTREICAVLSADKTIGLTVSQSGIMIPRKSVTAIMGVSRAPVSRRPSGCAACSMRGRCALSKEQRPSDAAGRQDTAERTDS